MPIIRSTAAWLLVATLATAGLRAEPADKAEVEALRAEVQQLRQQVDHLSRILAEKESASSPVVVPASPVAATPPPKPAPVAAEAIGRAIASDKGFMLASADGADVFKLRAMVQLDGRFFFGDRGATADTFILRRARIFAEGTFAKNYSFQIVPDFAGSAATILDANFGVRVNDALALKVGKFKSPVGLEELQADAGTFFNERSLVNNLMPNRDVGLLASGQLLSPLVGYTVAILSGVPDGGSVNADSDNDKDVAIRLTATPFKLNGGSPWQGLLVGIAGTAGRHKTAAGRAASYKTDGQQTLFSYSPTVTADGDTWRLSPQVDYRRGPFGLIGEYVVSAATLRSAPSGPAVGLRHAAWQVAAGYVLTGEDSSYAGVVPRTNFDWAAGTWGAFELTGRYAELDFDAAAFPLLASPTTNAAGAKAFGIGANWYLSKVVALKFDYYQTRFGFNAGARAATAPVLQQEERALISRFQLSF